MTASAARKSVHTYLLKMDADGTPHLRGACSSRRLIRRATLKRRVKEFSGHGDEGVDGKVFAHRASGAVRFRLGRALFHGGSCRINVHVSYTKLCRGSSGDGRVSRRVLFMYNAYKVSDYFQSYTCIHVCTRSQKSKGFAL